MIFYHLIPVVPQTSFTCPVCPNSSYGSLQPCPAGVPLPGNRPDNLLFLLILRSPTRTRYCLRSFTFQTSFRLWVTCVSHRSCWWASHCPLLCLCVCVPVCVCVCVCSSPLTDWASWGQGSLYSTLYSWSLLSKCWRLETYLNLFLLLVLMAVTYGTGNSTFWKLIYLKCMVWKFQGWWVGIVTLVRFGWL